MGMSVKYLEYAFTRCYIVDMLLYILFEEGRKYRLTEYPVHV